MKRAAGSAMGKLAVVQEGEGWLVLDPRFSPYAPLPSPEGRLAEGISGVAGIYNRATYAKEMREALERWRNHIEAITE